MKRSIQRFIAIGLLLILALSFGGIPSVLAKGSFDIPEIKDDFKEYEKQPGTPSDPFQPSNPVEPTKPETNQSSPPPKEEQSWWSKAWNWTKDKFTGAWNWTKDTASSAWNWTKDTASKVWNWTTDIVSSAWDWVTDTASKAWNWFTDILKLLTSIVIDNVAFVVGAVILGAAGLLYFVPGKPGYNKLSEWGKNLVGVDTSQPYNTLKDVQSSDRTLANASQLVYQDHITQKQIEQKLGEGWELDPHLYRDLGNGLQAKVFVNHETQEVIIAFRGTEFDREWQDVVIGDGPIAFGLDSFNAQAIDARKFVEEVLNDPRYQGYQPVLTGHSLGGYLALDSGAYFKVPTVTFNAPGKNLIPNVNASTLFGMGNITYAINMLDPKNRKQAINHGLGNYDGIIRNYEYGRDLVGELGHHPGESYHIDHDGSVSKDSRWDNSMPFVSFNLGKTHGIANFTGEDDGKKVDAPVIFDENGNIVPR